MRRGDSHLAWAGSSCRGGVWFCGCESCVNIGGGGFQSGFGGSRRGGDHCVCWSDG